MFSQEHNKNGSFANGQDMFFLIFSSDEFLFITCVRYVKSYLYMNSSQVLIVMKFRANYELCYVILTS